MPVAVCTAQNLVPNPSFEIYSSCPTGASQIFLAPPWTQPTTGTCDYFNACATVASTVSVPDNLLGHQYARTGNGYSGFFARAGGYVEYVQVPLTESLQAGEKYCVSFYISLSDTCAYSIYSVEMYISNTPPSATNYFPLPFTPQIQNPTGGFFNYNNWTEVSGTYTALGGEKYITIGNFDSNYYPDTLLLNSDTLHYNPQVSYLYLDDVSLALCDPLNDSASTLFLPNAFSPNGDGENDTLKIYYGNMNRIKTLQLVIYDRWGEQIFETTDKNFTWNGTYNDKMLNTQVLVYALHVEFIDQKLLDKKGNISLIR